MTITAPIFVRDLSTGDHVEYAGEQYTVTDVVPAAVLDSTVVLAYPVGLQSCRVALIYANASAVVELVT